MHGETCGTKKMEWKGKEEKYRMERERGILGREGGVYWGERGVEWGERGGYWGRRQECNGGDKGRMERKKRGTVKERWKRQE